MGLLLSIRFANAMYYKVKGAAQMTPTENWKVVRNSEAPGLNPEWKFEQAGSDWSVTHPRYGEVASVTIEGPQNQRWDQFRVSEGPVGPAGVRRGGIVIIPYRMVRNSVWVGLIRHSRGLLGGRDVLELPRGFVEPQDESALAAAERELIEEFATDIPVAAPVHIGSLCINTSFYSTLTECYAVMFREQPKGGGTRREREGIGPLRRGLRQREFWPLDLFRQPGVTLCGITAASLWSFEAFLRQEGVGTPRRGKRRNWDPDAFLAWVSGDPLKDTGRAEVVIDDYH